MEHFILCVFRNTSEARKGEIISDLQLPLSHPDKLLKAVVATISLGVGVDLRVKNVFSFGLGSTALSENRDFGLPPPLVLEQ